uniref:Uncharacterized protein n=1 Tax=Arundo donax TaxID=35708 RepID=A0A0A9F9G0_ARUDO
MVLEDMGADQTLLGPNNVAELALVPPYIPQRRRRSLARPATSAGHFPFPRPGFAAAHLTNP